MRERGEPGAVETKVITPGKIVSTGPFHTATQQLTASNHFNECGVQWGSGLYHGGRTKNQLRPTWMYTDFALSLRKLHVELMPVGNSRHQRSESKHGGAHKCCCLSIWSCTTKLWLCRGESSSREAVFRVVTMRRWNTFTRATFLAWILAWRRMFFN